MVFTSTVFTSHQICLNGVALEWCNSVNGVALEWCNSVNGVALEWCNSVKYLGMVIDNKLAFKPHLASPCLKLSQIRGTENIVSRQLPRGSLLTLYFSLIYFSIIESIIIWGGSSEKEIGRVRITIMTKILTDFLGERRNNYNVPLMNTNEMYAKLNYFNIWPDFFTKFYNSCCKSDLTCMILFCSTCSWAWL